MRRKTSFKKEKNILDRLSTNARVSLRMSGYISKQMFSKDIHPHHLFLGILFNKESLGSKALNTMGDKVDDILRSIVGDKGVELNKEVKESELKLSPQVKEIIRQGYSISNKLSHVYVGTEHLLLAILKSKDLEITKMLKEKGIVYSTFEEILFNFATYPVGILTKPDLEGKIDGEQSALSMFGRDFVKEAREGKIDPIVGREKEIQNIINVLSRRKKNNPLIVGESGVGKTAVVEALAQRIADGNVPQSLRDNKLISLDVTSIMAGSKMRGDVEEKMMAVIGEIMSSPDTILFIDEIHNILNSGIPGMPSDMVTVLKPALLQNDFRCIGATTMSEYRNYIEEDNALVRRFQPIIIEETGILETIQILRKIRPVLEAHHGIKIENSALEAAVKLSDRYVVDRFLPDKAIDLLDESCATRKLEAELESGDISGKLVELRTVQLEKEEAVKRGLMEKAMKLKEKEDGLEKEVSAWEKRKNTFKKSSEFEVGSDIVKRIVSKWTGIPISTLGTDEKSSLMNLEKALRRSVVGQKEAVSLVANAIKRARAGISDERRPWASFLFLGPTGVGKTELAKVLTSELFGDEDRLIQVDMSEMMEMHSVSKLIGSPPGYVGYKEGGQLTERIRRSPYSVILFDEVEKAHQDVLNILLQILEYGHLTDGRGRKVSFKNTIIIMTSNIGAEEISKDRILGFVADKKNQKEISDRQIENAYDSMKNELTKSLKGTLRPELINRLDDIVIFRSLTRRDAKKIVKLLLKDLNKRLKEQGIKVNVKEDLVDFIVKEGFSNEYGARPLRRMLQENVENVLANYLLQEEDSFKAVGIKELNLSVKNGVVEIQ